MNTSVIKQKDVKIEINFFSCFQLQTHAAILQETSLQLHMLGLEYVALFLISSEI